MAKALHQNNVIVCQKDTRPVHVFSFPQDVHDASYSAKKKSGELCISV